jgi:hypothetical protein
MVVDLGFYVYNYKLNIIAKTPHEIIEEKDHMIHELEKFHVHVSRKTGVEVNMDVIKVTIKDDIDLHKKKKLENDKGDHLKDNAFTAESHRQLNTPAK